MSAAAFYALVGIRLDKEVNNRIEAFHITGWHYDEWFSPKAFADLLTSGDPVTARSVSGEWIDLTVLNAQELKNVVMQLPQE